MKIPTAEEREALEEIKSKAILIKAWGNFYKCENNIFYSFAKSEITPHASGTWFNCGEEETRQLREAVLAGNFEVKTKIHRGGRVYRLPSEWVEEKK
ncbi:MAG: hypothetical protein GY714_19995 [Desulfobacterales bacterium]|nr:hypothetical protein [Desulfobacterales bacterium]